MGGELPRNGIIGFADCLRDLLTDQGRGRVAAVGDAELLAVSVKGTGCGISPSMHQARFERFAERRVGFAGNAVIPALWFNTRADARQFG